MAFYERYVKGDYTSYEDFMERFSINVPEKFNFAYDVVDEIAAMDPDRLAMIWVNEAGEEHRFTFQDMKEQSNRCANYFASLGIGKGDRVMLILKRHYEFWFSILALHRLGAVVIPATNLLMEKDVAYRIEAADITAVVCTRDGQVADEVKKAVEHKGFDTTLVMARGEEEGWHRFDDMYDFSPEFARVETDNSEPMLLYFTSGTTGMPKMVQHDFTYPLGHIVTAAFWQDVIPGGVHLTVSDTGWGKAIWGKLYSQWMSDTVVFTYDYDKFTPTDLLEKMQNYHITSFCAPPTIYRFMIQEDIKAYDLSALKHCAIAGEALNPEVYNKFYELTGIKLREAFGQTETTVVLGTFKWVEPVPGSMGKPSPGYRVCIADDDGNDVHMGSVGEICVRIDDGKPVGMFCGYYGDPERTHQQLNTGLFRTGDLAWMDEDGYFWYVGRVDDVIKSSGYRIGPFEVESALMEHPAVLETAITAVPDPIRGQVVKATVVLNRGWEPSDALVKELQNHVKKVTAPYKYPRVVEFVKELPKTISGKIRRVEIRENDSKKS
ncbi:MAG: acetyl-CoA synthetase [Clostridiales bacterium]|nr:acetyl-CoA synthetase [Clostridiales bacterium]